MTNVYSKQRVCPLTSWLNVWPVWAVGRMNVSLQVLKHLCCALIVSSYGLHKCLAVMGLRWYHSPRYFLDAYCLRNNLMTDTSTIWWSCNNTPHPITEVMACFGCCLLVLRTRIVSHFRWHLVTLDVVKFWLVDKTDSIEDFSMCFSIMLCYCYWCPHY